MTDSSEDVSKSLAKPRDPAWCILRLLADLEEKYDRGEAKSPYLGSGLIPNQLSRPKIKKEGSSVENEWYCPFPLAQNTLRELMAEEKYIDITPYNHGKACQINATGHKKLREFETAHPIPPRSDGPVNQGRTKAVTKRSR